MTVTDRLDAIEQRVSAATALTLGDDNAHLAYNVAADDVPALVAAIRGVLAVHAPGWGPVLAGHYCQGCGVGLTDDRPDCPTVAAITAALTEVTR